jgi:CheY-like chemotaxis protein
MTNAGSQALKVMVVDNDLRWRRFVRTLFSSDASVTECADGASAVIAYSKLLPDWVIMDIAMEPMDGLSAVTKIKQNFPRARVIFLTQFCEPEFRAEAARLGAVGYVLKDDVDRVQELILSNGLHDGPLPQVSNHGWYSMAPTAAAVQPRR